MTLSYVRSPITEPFMDAFYFGPQRQSRRFESGDWSEPNASYEAIAKALTDQTTTGDGNTVTFVKDMAFGMEGRFDILEEWFSNAKHSFLIRDPTKAIPSFYKMFTEPEIVTSGCVCFDPTETGYRQLYEMYEFVKDKLDSNPVVIDADDLLESPKQIMKAYCDGVGIKYDDCMTSWQAGEAPQSWISRPQWSLKWRQSAVDSSGFRKPRSVADETYPVDVMKAVEESGPFYEKLYSARLKLM